MTVYTRILLYRKSNPSRASTGPFEVRFVSVRVFDRPIGGTFRFGSSSSSWSMRSMVVSVDGRRNGSFVPASVATWYVQYGYDIHGGMRKVNAK
jgi:hypothetical protein